MAAGAATRSRRSDRRIPGHRDFAVARSVLLDIGERREWVVETLQQHLFRHQHVVDLAAAFLPPDGVPVAGGRPPATPPAPHTPTRPPRPHPPHPPPHSL